MESNNNRVDQKSVKFLVYLIIEKEIGAYMYIRTRSKRKTRPPQKILKKKKRKNQCWRAYTVCVLLLDRIRMVHPRCI